MKCSKALDSQNRGGRDGDGGAVFLIAFSSMVRALPWPAGALVQFLPLPDMEQAFEFRSPPLQGSVLTTGLWDILGQVSLRPNLHLKFRLT